MDMAAMERGDDCCLACFCHGAVPTEASSGGSAAGGMHVALGIATDRYGTPRPQRGQRGTAMTTTTPAAPSAPAVASTPQINAAPDSRSFSERITACRSAVSGTLAGW